MKGFDKQNPNNQNSGGKPSIPIASKIRILASNWFNVTDAGQGDSQANLHQYYLVYPDGNGSSLGKKVPLSKQYIEREYNQGTPPTQF